MESVQREGLSKPSAQLRTKMKGAGAGTRLPSGATCSPGRWSIVVGQGERERGLRELHPQLSARAMRHPSRWMVFQGMVAEHGSGGGMTSKQAATEWREEGRSECHHGQLELFPESREGKGGKREPLWRGRHAAHARRPRKPPSLLRVPAGCLSAKTEGAMQVQGTRSDHRTCIGAEMPRFLYLFLPHFHR